MKYFYFILMLYAVNYSYSQYYMEFQFGNSFPVFKNESAPISNGFHIDNQDTSIRKSNPEDVNLGVGVSGSFIFGKMFRNNKISLSLAGFYSNSCTGFLKNQSIYEYYSFSESSWHYELWDRYFKGQKIAIIPKINYYLLLGKITNSIGIGATFNLIYINEVLNFKYLTTGSLLSIEEKYKLTTKEEMGYSFLLEDKLLFHISNNLLFITTISFQPLQIHTNVGKRYSRKTIKVAANIYSEDTNTQIVAGNDGTFGFNFSAINISFGLRYSFGNKEKTAEEK